jgi:hypothetical protein
MILQDFKIFSSDTIESILIRISTSIDSLPRYIYLEDVNMNLSELKRRKILPRVRVIDLLSLIKDPDDNAEKFAKTLKGIMGYFPKLKPVDDIIMPWLYYHTQNIPDDQLPLIVFSYSDTINRVLGTKYNLDVNVQNRIRFFKDMKERIKENKKNAESLSVSEINVEPKQFTVFIPEKINYAIELGESTDTTINEVFNSVVLNTEIPFAALNGYYKVLKDFSPEPEWAHIEHENVVFLKLRKGANTYDDVKFAIHNGVFTILLDTDVDKKSKDFYVKTVLDIIPSSKPVITKEIPISIKGVFYIPNQTLQHYVFADLVMNDPSFASLIIDEVGKATKDKGSIYTYYNNGSYLMSTILTAKIMDRFDPTMKGQSEDLFPEGEPYLRVRVTSKDMENIPDLQENIARMMSLYNEKYDSIVEFYRQYIPNFPEARKKRGKELEKSKKPAKKPPGEAKRCQHHPIIIKESEIGKYSDIMRYPQDGKSKPQIYTCDIPERGAFKYVGLQLRKHTNEFAPCCFQVDQKIKKSSNYKKYLNYVETGELEISEETSKQQRIITTRKILSNGTSGIIYYPVLEKFLKISRNDIDYFRMGVNRSKMSFLNCIMEVFRSANEPAITLDDVHNKMIEITTNTDRLSVCRQQNPGKTPKQIKKDLLSDIYIDPRLYTRILEETFGCAIFVFSDRGLITPHYVKNFLSYNQHYDKVILLIEHMGAERDSALYPQCEIIVYRVGNKAAEYFFNNGHLVAMNLKEMFSDMTKSYVDGSRVKPRVLDIKPIGQNIDGYGKAISFVIKHKKGRVLMYSTTPCAPLPVPESIRETYILSSEDVIQDFPSARYVVRKGENRSICMLVEMENTYYIPIVAVENPENPIITTSREALAIISNVSGLSHYNLYKKLARYLTEYMFFAFSDYINLHSLDISDKSLDKFVKESVVISDKDYGNIGKNFNKSGSILSGGKLIIPSEEILRRLIYVLRLEFDRNTNLVQNYYKRVNIEAYISDISDFTIYTGQSILYGEQALLKYIEELKVLYRFNYDVGFNGDKPFFYRNPLLGDNMYLAQNTKNLDDAKSICYNWVKNEVNTQTPAHKSNPTIYSYVSNGDIEEIDAGEDCNVLGYKINNDSRFTVLM